MVIDPPAGPRVSFLMATHNRRDVLLAILARVRRCGLATRAFEIIVIDNASTDGTADAVRARFPDVILLRQPSNLGPCAKNAGLAVARGEFVVFLDDDSHPEPGSVGRMIERFRADPGLGAAMFTVTLPSGARECSAYPDVCIGCGTGFRRAALLDVGGLPEDFFMAAEEYDLSLRLLDAGWRLQQFDDLHVAHLKTAGSRFPARVVRLDARNNTMLALRYFPERWRMPFARSWLERYRLIAQVQGQRRAFWMGAAEGMLRGMVGEHRPIRDAAFEQFARIEQTRLRLRQHAARLRLRRVLFIDLGKNMLPYLLAARACGVDVVGIADAGLGGRGLSYGRLPVLTDTEAARLSYDAAIVSNLSPVHAANRLAHWQGWDHRPVIDLFQPASAPFALRAAA